MSRFLCKLHRDINRLNVFAIHRCINEGYGLIQIFTEKNGFPPRNCCVSDYPSLIIYEKEEEETEKGRRRESVSEIMGGKKGMGGREIEREREMENASRRNRIEKIDIYVTEKYVVMPTEKALNIQMFLVPHRPTEIG